MRLTRLDCEENGVRRSCCGNFFRGRARARAGRRRLAGLQAGAFLDAVNQVFLSTAYFAGIDYAVFIKARYNTGPDLPRPASGEPLIRFADEIVPFSALRRSLYKAVKINHGAAEYYFEIPRADEALPADYGPVRLDFDEFVARRLDLLSFRNRFPQVKKSVRLLKKVPSAPGLPGYELSGLLLQPAPPADVALAPLAGEGTEIVLLREGEFLISSRDGFVNIDSDSGQLSITAKIVSKDGVSGRTTGNLHLNAEYEEFGEVREPRLVDGRDITIHGDVFGNVHSQGGTAQFKRNIIGGSALNDAGDIRVSGVASGALLRTRKGEVHIERAESCVISIRRQELVLTAEQAPQFRKSRSAPGRP